VIQWWAAVVIALAACAVGVGLGIALRDFQEIRDQAYDE
jgi:NADH:ubiquinone oxidoreductase subunit K